MGRKLYIGNLPFGATDQELRVLAVAPGSEGGEERRHEDHHSRGP